MKRKAREATQAADCCLQFHEFANVLLLIDAIFGYDGLLEKWLESSYTVMRITT